MRWKKQALHILVQLALQKMKPVFTARVSAERVYTIKNKAAFEIEK